MTRDEALKYTHLFSVSTDFDPHMTLPEKTAMARGFLEGYEQGVMDSVGVSGSVSCICHKDIFKLLDKK